MSTVRRFWMLLTIISLTFIAAETVFSMDGLELKGIVTKVDPKAKQIQVELLNSDCKGTRTFNDPNAASYRMSVGKKFVFLIDGQQCPRPNEVRTIVPYGGKH